MILKRGWIFTAMVLLVIASGTIAFIFFKHAGIYIVAACMLMLVLIFLLWRAVTRPLDMVENGMGMLVAQDFGSRLRKVGEVHADKIVDMFNNMVSELKNERLKLSEQERFLKQLVEVSPMGIAVMDFDYNITMVNRSFMLMAGLSGTPESLEGKSFREVSSELVEHIFEIKPGESETLRFSDMQIYRISNLWFMEKGFRRPFVLVESMTEEVMKAERQAYEKVIRVISHEVNNSMGGVISLLEMIADTTEDDEMREVLVSGEERCRSLSQFIRNYADIVKLSDPVIVLKDIVKEIIALEPFLRMITGNDIDLELRLPDETLNAGIDTVMFQQVMINIVKNAAESVRAKSASDAEFRGKICIVVDEDSSHGVEIEITDNGMGIAPETSGKLFTPFFSTKSNGRGIGLTLVNEILTRHNCRFSLRTEKDGETHFRIRFRRQLNF